MDTRTGKLYESYDDAVKELQSAGASKEEIIDRLIRVGHDDFEELRGMNRAERRRWAKEQRRKNKRGPK